MDCTASQTLFTHLQNLYIYEKYNTISLKGKPVLYITSLGKTTKPNKYKVYLLQILGTVSITVNKRCNVVILKTDFKTNYFIK